MKELILKSSSELVSMRRACRLAAKTLEEAAKLVKVGENTESINDFVHNYTLKNRAIPAPLNYKGFPKSVCTSVNDVVCHGIPSKDHLLQDGDIINIDITSILDGWHGDVSATFYVGTPSKETVNLVESTRRSLELGIAQCMPDNRIGDIGAAIQSFAEARGFAVVRDFVGHGIGRQFHENLQIPHYGKRGRGMRLKAGMTFTVEPMLNAGDWRLRILEDGWTAVTLDRKYSAQFEHTLLITDDGPEILTQFEAPLQNSITPAWFKF